MKKRIKVVITTLFLGGFIAMSSCGGGGACPDGTYDTLAECADAIGNNNDICECVTENGKWKIIDL